MRLSRGIAPWAVLFSCATLATCVFPTERDDSVRVTIEPLPVLVRGDETYATARAWHILAVADSQEIANVTFIWSSDDPLTATVDAAGHIVGIKSGTTAIRAAAANFDKRAAAGQIALRVANTLEIDSIRPATVKYGEVVTVYGLGLLDTPGLGLGVGGARLSSAVPGTFQTYLTASLGLRASDTTYHVGRNAWTFGPQSHACHGAAFGPKEAPAESTVVALHDFADTSLDAIAVYSREGRYSLAVIEGYVLGDKRIARDSHEEDNFCDAADAKPLLLGSLPNGTYLDTLAIENPHDVDWFRFNVPGSLPQPVRVRTAARPFGATDTSDIDLYVLNVPAPGDTIMTAVATAATAGSTVDMTLTLAPKDYYAVVVDFAGEPTRYSICIGLSPLLSPACQTLPAAPPVGLGSAASQASVLRRARLEAAIRRRSSPLR